ncbi:unnamed protein product [Cochlearia groenlandica]
MSSSSGSVSSSSSSSGSSLSSNTLRHLERGASGTEVNQGNSRLLPRSDSARDHSGEGFVPVSGGFMFDPSTQMPQTPVRQKTEVPSLVEEEITPPPLVRPVLDNRSALPNPELTSCWIFWRARRQPKKPRHVNSFTSSASRFGDGLDNIQALSGAHELLDILEPQPGKCLGIALRVLSVYMSRRSPKQAFGFPFPDFWLLIANGGVWRSPN